jgi:hypothetical protein
MNHFPLLDVLIDDDDSSQISKLEFFANNIKKEIVGFQIETKKKFSFVKIFINLKRCHLQF